MMSDSEEQGFLRDTIEMVTIRPNKLQSKNAFIYRSPLCLFYEQPLFEYPRMMDCLNPIEASPSLVLGLSQGLQLIERTQEAPILLSQFFPRRLSCVYNRFRQNLMLKRDTTAVIRSIVGAVRREQLATFHEESSNKSLQVQSIIFSSNFEGGNLHSVFKSKKSNHYYLLLQNDINTHGYSIWFHFRVKAQQEGRYSFIIANLSREVKFFQVLFLLTFSSFGRRYLRKTGIKCKETMFRHCGSGRRYWALQFEYSFRQGEEVYFSLCPPYTFSRLLRLFKEISFPVHNGAAMSIQIAGKSELGNSIPCLRIWCKERPSRKCILILSRQHPCEVTGSFVCEEMIKSLVGGWPLALQLLKLFTFVVFPMVNPDGVIHGGSRTNAMGYDLNRNWGPNPPSVVVETAHIWTYLLEIFNSRNDFQAVWAIDLHAHSKQLGYFGYFCQQNQTNLLMAYLLAKDSLFQLKKCSFSLQNSKKNSARGQFYHQLGVANPITIEASYYGYKDSTGTIKQFQHSDYRQMAQNILQSLLSTEQTLSQKAEKQKIINEAVLAHKRAIEEQKLSLEEEDYCSGSDSDPEGDYLRLEQRKEVLGIQKNFRIKTENAQKDFQRGDFSWLSKGKSTGEEIVPSKKVRKDSFSQRNPKSTFYAGRSNISPKTFQKYPKARKRRQGELHSSLSRSCVDELDPSSQYLKRSMGFRGSKIQQDEKKLRTLIGGFRTCKQGQGVKTIVYPTALSSGMDFQANMRVRRETVKEQRIRMKLRKMSEASDY